MAQTPAQDFNREPNPLDESGLCLLSLDGGGVRGLSTLYILRILMNRLNNERQQKGLSTVKPCEVFDLIGGTSTGGLIAIMLGRLEMDVDECISAYNSLMKSVFEERSHRMLVGWTGRTKARFSLTKLKNAIEKVFADRRISGSDHFNDGNSRGCRVFVCAAAKETTSTIRLRSYALSEEPEIPATILEAALATSAATTFFEPVLIGVRQFVDGGLGANNPVEEVEGEASNIWCPKERDIKASVKCFVSIGTGSPGKRAIEDKLIKFVSKTLVDIATETEKTERNFITRWAQSFDSKRYFRFNVDQGLQDVELAEYKKEGRIEAATHDYLTHPQQKSRMGDCIDNLWQKQNKTDIKFAVVMRESITNVKNVHFAVPRILNTLFTGRMDTVEKIRRAILVPSGSCPGQKRFVITGDGGQGKSELCIKVADVVRQLFWGIFWIDAGQLSTAEKDFMAVARKLGSSAENFTEARQVLADTNNSWLLILDNADDPTFDYQRFFPNGDRGAVIMTSRNPECAKYSTVGSAILEHLSPEHSTQLLLKAANVPEVQWSAHDEHVKAILDLVQSHTLALIQAGAYVAQGHCTLGQFPSVYERQRSRLLRYRPTQMQSRYGDVYATFEASAEILERSNTEAAKDALRLLDILSVLHYSLLPVQIFEEAWKFSRDILDDIDPDNREDLLSKWHVSQLPRFINAAGNEWDSFGLTKAIILLASLSLVHKDKFLSISMHPLTHAWAKDRQEPDQYQASWISAGCLIAVSWWNSEYWTGELRRLQPHILSFININVETVISYGSESAELPILYACGWALLWMREDKRLSGLLDDILNLTQINVTESSQIWLKLYELRGENYRKLELVKEAIEMFEQVVEVTEKTLTESHYFRLSSQHGLASAYRADGRTQIAVDLMEQVVKIKNRTLTQSSPTLLSSQHGLAYAYFENGQIKEAIKLLEHIVNIKSTLAETHPSRLASQHELARAYLANGQISESIELLEHVVGIQNMLAETHPSRLISEHELARAYWEDGQTQKAIELLQHVVNIRKLTLSETHPSRVRSEKRLARYQKAMFDNRGGNDEDNDKKEEEKGALG